MASTWDENYGAGGVAGGANIAFTVGRPTPRTTFSYVLATHVLTVTTGRRLRRRPVQRRRHSG